MDLVILLIVAAGLVHGREKQPHVPISGVKKHHSFKRAEVNNWRNVTLLHNSQRLVALHVPDRDGRPLELQFKDRKLKMRIRVPHHKNGTAITDAIVMEFENTDGKDNSTALFKLPIIGSTSSNTNLANNAVSSTIGSTSSNTNLVENSVSSFVGKADAPSSGIASKSPLQEPNILPAVNFGNKPVSPSQAQDDDIGFKISQALNAYMPHDNNGHVKVYDKKINGIVHIFPYGGQKVQQAPQNSDSKPINGSSIPQQPLPQPQPQPQQPESQPGYAPYKGREPWVRHQHRKNPKWRRRCRIMKSGRRVCRRVRIRRPHRHRHHHGNEDDDSIPQGGLQGMLDPKYRNIEWHNAPDIEDDFADNGIENKISKILDKLHLQQQVQGNEISKDDPVSITQDENQQFMNNPMTQMLPGQQDATSSMLGQDQSSFLGQQNSGSQGSQQVEIGPAAAQQLLQQMMQQQTENNLNSQAVLPQSGLQSADMSQLMGQMNTGGIQSVTGLGGMNSFLGQQGAEQPLLGKQAIQQPVGLNMQSAQPMELPASVQGMGQTGGLAQLAGNQGISLQTDQAQSMLGGQLDEGGQLSGQLGGQLGSQLGGQLGAQLGSDQMEGQLSGQLSGQFNGQMGGFGGQMGMLSQKHQISARPSFGSKLFDPGILKKIAERENMDMNESRAKAELVTKYPNLVKDEVDTQEDKETITPQPYLRPVPRLRPPPRHYLPPKIRHRRRRYNNKFKDDTGVLGGQMISVFSRDKNTNYPERF